MNKEFYTYFSHLTVLVELPLEIDNIVPKNEVFSVPQLGQGPFNKKNNNNYLSICIVHYNLTEISYQNYIYLQNQKIFYNCICN